MLEFLVSTFALTYVAFLSLPGFKSLLTVGCVAVAFLIYAWWALYHVDGIAAVFVGAPLLALSAGVAMGYWARLLTLLLGIRRSSVKGMGLIAVFALLPVMLFFGYRTVGS